MSEKGISEIIATILMLMITIGLAGTAFIYISGFLKGTTEKRIALLDVSCEAGSKVYFVVKNLDPNVNIGTNELTVFFDKKPVTPSGWSPDPNTIQPQNTTIGTITCSATSPCESGKLYTVKVVGPSNSDEKSVAC
jgi:flagellin-like protein